MTASVRTRFASPAQMPDLNMADEVGERDELERRLALAAHAFEPVGLLA
jgi:hypothetical protein